MSGATTGDAVPAGSAPAGAGAAVSGATPGEPLVDGQSAALYGPEVIPAGRTVRVTVPASSGNVGPGYDCLGLALGRYDRLTVTRTGSGLTFELTGEGSDEVPRTAEHLVIRAMRTAWRAAGLHELPGLHVVAENRIPHSRGMGSSASAIVAGVAAANALLPEELRLDANALLQICSQMEGHPDNVAPSLLGGLVISYAAEDGYRSVPVRVHGEIRPVVAVPDYEVPTRLARGLIPEAVPHRDAAANSGRAALLVHAATADPAQLFAGTADLLHQQYRAGAMAPSAALLARLRGRGLPAIISGAGPTVLVLAEDAERAALAAEEIRAFGEDPASSLDGRRVTWAVEELTVDAEGVIVETVESGELS